MKYRRFYRNGGTYFFTVVANKRQKILTDDAVRLALRQAVMAVRERYPFEILAWVLNARPSAYHMAAAGQ